MKWNLGQVGSQLHNEGLKIISDHPLLFLTFPVCSNETVIPEVRLNDVLSERLIRQVWNDIRAKLSEDGEFRGMKIDPLDIGDIHQNQKCKNSF